MKLLGRAAVQGERVEPPPVLLIPAEIPVHGESVVSLSAFKSGLYDSPWGPLGPRDAGIKALV